LAGGREYSRCAEGTGAANIEVGAGDVPAMRVMMRRGQGSPPMSAQRRIRVAGHRSWRSAAGSRSAASWPWARSTRPSWASHGRSETACWAWLCRSPLPRQRPGPMSLWRKATNTSKGGHGACGASRRVAASRSSATGMASCATGATASTAGAKRPGTRVSRRRRASYAPGTTSPRVSLQHNCPC